MSTCPTTSISATMWLTPGPRKEPDKPALLWTNDRGEKIQFTFADIKRESDRTASFFQSLGIGRGDMVMLILKRHYQFLVLDCGSPQARGHGNPGHPPSHGA